MRTSFVRASLSGLLAGLLLAACGGPAEPGAAPEADTLGTAEGALCAGTTVTGLGISSAASTGGTLNASGTWAVGGGANAAKVEYWVDGSLRSYDERLGASGSWTASAGGIACGSHTLEVRAYPMVVDSAGNRTYCTSNGPVTTSQAFTQGCPTATLTCTRTSTTGISCTGTGSGSIGPYTALWNERVTFAADGSTVQTGFYEGSSTTGFFCPTATSRPFDQLVIELKVRDAAGMESSVRFKSYPCFF